MKNFVCPSIVSDETIEQLVDGELSGDRYGELLRTLNKSPDGWRRCALAFLQEQALTRELRTLSQTGFNLASELPGAETQAMAAVARSRTACDRSDDSNRAMWRAAGKLNLLSMAASILFAFAVGWYGAGLHGFRSTASSDFPGTQAGLSNIASKSNESQTLESSFPVSLNPNDFDPVRYLFSANKSFVPIDRKIPEQFLELERLGFVQIETIDGVVPVELEDGSAAIIPVQNFRVRPVRYAY